MDGIDVALIQTDGESVKDTRKSLLVAYPDALKKRIKEVIKGRGDFLAVERDITKEQAKAVNKFLKKYKISKNRIDVIGFHGQTIVHRPKEGITWQMGNGALLAELTGIDVVCDFRRRDVAAGGQGAPLVPLYHAAIARKMHGPVVIVNIGGVSNITYIKDPKNINKTQIIAFDTGPGNAPIDDFIHHRTGKKHDTNGAIAAKGEMNLEILKKLSKDQYFKKKPPKSLDRHHFHKLVETSGVKKLSTPNGAATLAAFTALCIAESVKHFPAEPKNWLIAGGGRKNKYIMNVLGELVEGKVQDIDAMKFDGDALEAQAFAFLAVRSLKGLHLSLPTTTGLQRLVTGGAFYRA